MNERSIAAKEICSARQIHVTSIHVNVTWSNYSIRAKNIVGAYKQFQPGAQN